MAITFNPIDLETPEWNFAAEMFSRSVLKVLWDTKLSASKKYYTEASFQMRFKYLRQTSLELNNPGG